MKTKTILNAYIKARDKRFALNAPHKRFRQCDTFRAELLRRIEDGDKAKKKLDELERIQHEFLGI